MGDESPSGVLEQPVIVDHGEIDEDAGRETHIECEDVDVVFCAPAFAIFGFESQVFFFMRLAKKKTGGTDFV